MSSAALPLTAERPPLPVARFSVEQYHGMIEAGVFDESDRVELVEGWIVPKIPQPPKHSSACDLLEEFLRALLPAGWYVRSEKPITLPDSEPEPDIAVTRGRPGEYVRRHPGPGDVALVVEVSRSSVAGDLLLKPRVYARAGVVEYWVVNTVKREIEVFADPAPALTPPRYRHRQKHPRRDSIPFGLEGKVRGHVAVADVFPARAR